LLLEILRLLSEASDLGLSLNKFISDGLEILSENERIRYFAIRSVLLMLKSGRRPGAKTGSDESRTR
jgi:hypothetical protein